MIHESSAVTERLEKQVFELRAACRQAEDFVDLTRHSAWPNYVRRFTERLHDIEGQLDHFEQLTAEDRSLLLKERVVLRNIANMATDLDSDLPKLYADLKLAEAKLNERKARNTPVNS